MYEHQTYEQILARMLDAVLARQPNLDTREGSIIYDACAPAALELANLYIACDTILVETFADTASRTFLLRRAAERGITPYPATHAILRGEFSMDIPIGARFSLDTLNYVAIDRIEPGAYRMQCETAGSHGNRQLGRLIPIDHIPGLKRAQLTALLIPGEDAEDTEHLRQRYFDSLNAEAFGGNMRQYEEWADAIPGVGGCKVYPVWNGGGTVRLVIIGSDYAAPTAELVSRVQTMIDPDANGGQGFGQAPIGHRVTVQGVMPVAVDIGLTIAYQEGYDWERVRPAVEAAMDEYFLALARGWHEAEALVVRVSGMEQRVLEVEGVLDVTDTTIAGAPQNLVLGADDIPVRGTVHG